uniref:Uncharacterized protein n=1 Tax=Sus scrofa TaxID=9823 RepID=A0A8D1IK87_PIG
HSRPASEARKEATAAPPDYPKISKDMRRVFTRTYSFLILHFTFRTQKELRRENTSQPMMKTQATKISGGGKTSYKENQYGMKRSEAWEGSDKVGNQGLVKEKTRRGGKASLDNSMRPNPKKKNTKINTLYRAAPMAIECTAAFGVAGPRLPGAIKKGYKDFLRGVLLQPQCKNSRIAHSNFIASRVLQKFQGQGSNLNDSNDLSQGFWKEISKLLQCHARCSWTSTNSN